MSETDFDAIVIGAGVIGAAVALSLSRAGRRVLVLDKGAEAGHGSTAGSCAIIRPYYSTLDGCALAYESHFYWRDWEAHLGTSDERGLARYVNCGCTVMKTPGNNYLTRAMDLMEEIGAPYQDWDAATLRNRLPWLSTDSYFPPRAQDDPAFGQPNGGTLPGAVFFEPGGYVTDPALAAHNLMRAAEAAGAVFRFNTAVTAIPGEGAVTGVVVDGGERIAAGIVVNVAGPHSDGINAMAGVAGDMTIRTRALRHEVAHVPAPPDPSFAEKATVFSDSDTSAYTRPERGEYLLIGSEDPYCDPPQWVDPDDFDRDFSDRWTTLVIRAGQRVPTLGVPSTARGVVELYDVSDDWIPIYDRSMRPGYYMAIGTSGNQFKNAPVVGEMMAALIDACEGGHDHDADPLGFDLNYTGRRIDLGFYSRRRTINPESSMSVLG